MDARPYFDSHIGNHNKCTSNCVVRKRDIPKLQQRIRPEYTGPFGIVQALADVIKLLLKENLLLSRGDTHLFSIRPSIAVI